MGCCNEKRTAWAVSSAGASAPLSPRPAPPMAHEIPMTKTVGFEYVGDTAMSVLGPITRTHYRFRGPGARLEVDHRDAPYFGGVPNLRRF